MTALIIIGSIILFFAVILSFSISIKVIINENISVSFGAFGFYKEISFVEKEKIVKEEVKEKPTKSAKSKIKQESEKKPSESTFGDMVKIAIDMITEFLPPIGKMLKKIRLTELTLCMTVVSDEADATAIKYGQVSMLIYNILGQLDNAITVKPKRISIVPDFVGDEAQYDIFFKVKLRFSTILRAGFCMLGKFLVKLIKMRTQSPNKKAVINKK